MLSESGDKSIDFGCGSLGNQLDSSIGQVTDRAGHSETRSESLRCRPEPHSLNVTAEPDGPLLKD